MKQKGTMRQPAERILNGHNYCWVEYKDTGRRCTLPKGHKGTHLFPYSPCTQW